MNWDLSMSWIRTQTQIYKNKNPEKKKKKTLHHPICLWKSHLGPLCVQCIQQPASPCRRHAPVLLGKTKGLCTMSWVVSQPFLLEPLGRTHGPIFQHQSCRGDVCVCWSGFYHWGALWIVEGNGVLGFQNHHHLGLCSYIWICVLVQDTLKSQFMWFLVFYFFFNF